MIVPTGILLPLMFNPSSTYRPPYKGPCPAKTEVDPDSWAKLVRAKQRKDSE